MPLSTLERSPPPFFKQGPSAFTRLLFYSALAVLMMVADVRWKVTQPLRVVVATAFHPLQEAALSPTRGWAAMGHYFAGLDTALASEKTAQRLLTAQAQRIMRADQLERENAQLRALLELRPRLETKTLAAEVLYDAQDPFTRKVVIDRGSSQGVLLASPVLDDVGVLGQVTRVYPLTSEVTLVTDRDAAVPVINVRSQQRGVAYGAPQTHAMELRFMASNADVQVGDVLQTSGLDGIYPAGMPVAKVVSVDRRADTAFARIALSPMAHPDRPHHVLLLQPQSAEMPARPEGAAAGASSAPELGKKGKAHGAAKGARP
ncbi:MAG: rod shape-determining protein MreC [Burkholderiales bacterium]|nr:rod shape-determining protein MreC [Burkholderiales bacterium]